MVTIHQILRGSKPAVLTQAMINRLEAVNRVSRVLRSKGLRVIREELYPEAGVLPELEIERDPLISIAPILDAAMSKEWRNVGGRQRGRAMFPDVVVTWWELK